MLFDRGLQEVNRVRQIGPEAVDRLTATPRPDPDRGLPPRGNVGLLQGHKLVEREVGVLKPL